MLPDYFGKVESPNLPQFMEVNFRNNIIFDIFDLMSRIGLLIILKQLLKVSTLCPHTCMNMATSLVNCFVNYAVVHIMPNMQQTLFQFIDIVYP